MSMNTRELIVEFLELNYELFQQYLEEVREIEPTEAELIIDELKEMD